MPQLSLIAEHYASAEEKFMNCYGGSSEGGLSKSPKQNDMNFTTKKQNFGV